MKITPPRDNLVRTAGFELRAAEDGGTPTLTGHFAVFNEWTEINSIFEGRFMESIAPGALDKTIQENRSSMRVLFQHGRDPQVGDKPLGPISVLEADSKGARYEVPLLDASYVRDLVLPGLEAGLYGASFRFRVTREEINDEPGRSKTNPEGIPERVIKEMAVREFGPVTFPAYESATAGVQRSLTDEFLLEALLQDPERLRALLESREEAAERVASASNASTTSTTEAAPSTDAALTSTSEERRAPTTPLYGLPEEAGKESWRV